jgi:hypothetical protein
MTKINTGPGNALPTVRSGSPTALTLEQAGIWPESTLVASPEEVAQREREEAKRLEVLNGHMDRVLASIWSCRCCGEGVNVSGGLCGPCRLTINQLRAARHASETVNGKSRRDLALAYIDRQEAS